MPHTTGKRRRTRGRRPARNNNNTNKGGGKQEGEEAQRQLGATPPSMPQPPDNFLRRLLDNIVPAGGKEHAARRRAASDDRRPLWGQQREQHGQQQPGIVAAPSAGGGRRAKTQTKRRRTRHRRNNNMVVQQRAGAVIDRPAVARRQVYCRLAHGGPVVPIGDVANLSDLYYKIGGELGLAEGGAELLYCTMGGAHYDADRVVSTATAAAALPHGTVLTAFVLGERKLLTASMHKVAGSDEFGITVADNGVGRLYVKRVKAGSFAAQLSPALCQGDAIVGLNGRPTTGLAHYELAKMLRQLADGAEFSMKLCGPLLHADGGVPPPVPLPARLLHTALKRDDTVRYRAEPSSAHGVLTVVAADRDERERVLTAVTKLIDDYLGVEDDELAHAFVHHGLAARDPLSYSASVQSSPSLQRIGLPQALLYDIYGVVRDWQRQVAVAGGGGGETHPGRACTADATTASYYTTLLLPPVDLDSGGQSAAAAGPSSAAVGKIDAMFAFLDDDQ